MPLSSPSAVAVWLSTGTCTTGCINIVVSPVVVAKLPGPAAAQVLPVGAAADAVSALLNLGFRPAEAANAVSAAEEDLGATATLDALVRLALRKAAK